MAKEKNKLGQQNFLQKFYNEHLLVRRDFYYEIEHEPQEVIAALENFWSKKGKNYDITVSQLEDDEVWNVNLWTKRYSSQTLAKIYSKDSKTVIEGTASLSDYSPLFYILIGWVFLMLSPLTLIFIQADSFRDAVGPMLFFFVILIIGLLGRNSILNDHKQLIEFIEKFVDKEERKLDIEWEKEYKKEKVSGQ